MSFRENWRSNMKDGYQFGDIGKSVAQSAVQSLYKLSPLNVGKQIGSAVAANYNMENQTAMNMWNEYKDWSTEMSNTAVQRGAADLAAAGFNPALAVSSGVAASGATGSAPTPSTGMAEASMNGIIKTLNSAMIAMAGITAKAIGLAGAAI